MVRATNYATLMLTIIVIVLIIGLGVAVYYVLDLDWFNNQAVQVYEDNVLNNQQQKPEVIIQKEISYDITKRTYNIVLNTDEFKVVVYTDGTVGITMLENEEYKEITGYRELLNKEVKLETTNIIRAYEVWVSTDDKPNSYIVLLDNSGNIYELVKEEIVTNSKYSCRKIEGLAKIIDIKQITNDNLTENIVGINAVAIDSESNELLLTEYLINK